MSDAPHILLIDGNHEDNEYYAQHLRTASPDYVVGQAATGRAGLALCTHQSIDCVVVELELPDISGFEVLLKLVPRVQHPELAVIILTRLWNPHLLEAAIKNGAQAALHKTMVSGDILHRAILKAISAVHEDRNSVTPFTTKDAA